VLSLLKKEYPNPKIALEFRSPWESLVATILSAQCTDARVNIVTQGLFQKYRTVQDYAEADLRNLQQDVRSTGFYRHKAQHIKESARRICKDFDGKVPSTMNELLTLPGVARKTANVVLHNVFGKNEGIAVDTHVSRVSQRLGLTLHSDPVRIEQDLMTLLDKKEWGDFSLRLIAHGRRTCIARNPKCPQCIFKGFCPWKKGKRL
jgi:endonuclease-3